MKSTANFALPYPESSDHTRTWEYWQGLAEAVDTLLKSKFVQFDASGAIKVTAGGVTRPLPFAHATGVGLMPNTGGPTPSLAVTYPAGRFTSAPAVTAMTYSNAVSIHIVGNTATAVTFFGFNAGATFPQTSFNWLAVQEAPAGGLVVAGTAGEPSTVTAICHTDGCDNAGVPIEVAVWPGFEDAAIMCGVCYQPITDVTAPVAP